MYLGIDIGSSSSKVLALNERGDILGSAVYNMGTGTNGVQLALEEFERKSAVSLSQVKYCVVTGYGRMKYSGADEQITEISCHAKGAFYLYPEARTIIDIGGQDAKAIQLSHSGRVENFVMNEKCAAGTGRFFEVMARVLNCPLQELPLLAAKADKDIQISSTCTVFAESEMISQLSGGETRQNVAKGAHIAVAKRVAGLVKRVTIRSQVIMTGGVAMNPVMAACMSEQLGVPVLVPENPQIVGALGAALFAREHYDRKNDEMQ